MTGTKAVVRAEAVLASFDGSEPPLEGIVCVHREKKGRTVGDVRYPSYSGFGGTIFLKTESCKK